MNSFKSLILILLLIEVSTSNTIRSGERRFLEDYTDLQGTDVRTSLFPEFHESSSMQHLSLLTNAAKASDVIKKYIADNNLNNLPQDNEEALNEYSRSEAPVFDNNPAQKSIVIERPTQPNPSFIQSESTWPQVPSQRSWESPNRQASSKWTRKSVRSAHANPSGYNNDRPVMLEENEWLYDTSCRSHRRCRYC